MIELKSRMSNSGYECVTLTDDTDRRTSLGIHRLLGLAFLPHNDDQTEVNRIDGDKNNNNLSNLEWVSHSENEQHKVEMLMTRRTKPVVFENIDTGERIVIPSTREADRMLGVSVNTVSRALQKSGITTIGKYKLYFYC